jgi:putative Ca2+/H+ antiporter (TMEM165/GDT1 family)
MDPSDAVQRPKANGDFGWLREAGATVLTGEGGAGAGGGMESGIPPSFLMVLITEIGDKTFFLAMLLSMRHGKLPVFIGTMFAMFFMTLGSSLAGYLVSTSAENLASTVRVMDYVAALLFAAFAFQLFRDAHKLHVKERNDAEVHTLLGGEAPSTHGELLDAEETLQEEEEKSGGRGGEAERTWVGGITRTFALMFVAEWGDRSMFATMALATQHDPSGVIVGAMLAHACANTTAVVGGEMLGKHISEKIMALSGAVVFSVFAVASLWKGLTAEEVPLT